MCLEPNFAPRLSWMIGDARWRPCCQLSWCDSRFLFQLRKQIQSMQNLADCQRSCYHDVGTSSTEWLHEESSSEVPREAEGPVGICGNKTRYSGQIPQKIQHLMLGQAYRQWVWSFMSLESHWVKGSNLPFTPTCPEKLAQRDVQSMRDLMEICCVWVAIQEPIRLHVGDAAYHQLDEMFGSGNLFIKLDSADLVWKEVCRISYSYTIIMEKGIDN